MNGGEKNPPFPEIEPYQRGMLDLDGHHRMYWEQSGNPKGAPAVFLHGGPGAGAMAAHRRFFDPDHWRIIVFDQRGAGRSEPHGEIKDNTTGHLIADMEALRRHLEVEKWLLFGGSWGVLLGLAYGIKNPGRCSGFVLRGIFLGRDTEIDWFLYGMAGVFPEAWRDFSNFLPADERNDLLEGYHRRLTDPQPGVHQPAAEAWSRYERACSTLLPNAVSGSARGALSLARIEAHYFKHAMFVDAGQLLEGVKALTHIPAILVQGRYDMICPAAGAFTLASAWPGAELVMVPDAGHSAMEPSIRSALIAATEKMKAPQ